MTVRRATDKERRKKGKAWIIRRSKPVTPLTPPDAPWSIEAVEAYDAAAYRRKLPPMLALNFRRIESSNSPKLRGKFDLHLANWYFSIRECLWFVSSRGEWVQLPTRKWIDQSGREHYEDVLIFSEVHAERFQHCALLALRRHLAALDAEEVHGITAPDDDQTPPEQPRRNGHTLWVGHDPDDVPF
jgi:hypothetical protein